MVYLFSPSLGNGHSTVIIFHGLNLILYHFVAFNVYIIVKVYRYLLGCLNSSSCSKKCKVNLIISPFLFRYNSSKPTFLKTDWSAGGMRYILIQPDNSPESLVAIVHLEPKG